MIVADANLLVYALHSDLPGHAAARRWLEQSLAGDEPLALCWVVILAVVRLCTNARLFPAALTVEQVLQVVQAWLDHPSVVLLQPGPRHWEILAGLLRQAGAAGNLTMDAHLAALALEHGGVVHSSDADFRRFPGLRFCNPLV
ncbi:MAG: type II toxin-antitoxin system VapC family toxin [Cyanobium sp. PLM2.Bin73]|nr:MAG: type II toxin-antitoxin system VapC family toxin [Cyanobium sp. PLM2.Bin73]